MSLEPGIRLSPSYVIAKIGEGGMGEGYQVRDTKLDRDVALRREYSWETNGAHLCGERRQWEKPRRRTLIHRAVRC